MNVAILCNSPIAVPAIELLCGRGVLAGIGIPSIQHDGTVGVRMLADARQQDLTTFDEDGFAQALADWLQRLSPDAVFVVTFPYRLPVESVEEPPEGLFNFHPGLLPKYRGPDPIFWQIRNEEPFGGISIHKVSAVFDSGPIAHVEKVAIPDGTTYGSHLLALARVMPQVTESMFDRIKLEGSGLSLKEQDPSEASFQRRPKITDLFIDWARQPAREIGALVRAANPHHGGAITFLRGVPLRVFQVTIKPGRGAGKRNAGAIVAADNQGGTIVQSSDGPLVRLDILQLEDGLFTGDQFARTFDVKPGEILTCAPSQGSMKFT